MLFSFSNNPCPQIICQIHREHSSAYVQRLSERQSTPMLIGYKIFRYKCADNTDRMQSKIDVQESRVRSTIVS